jgi:hypothetical protein
MSDNLNAVKTLLLIVIIFVFFMFVVVFLTTVDPSPGRYFVVNHQTKECSYVIATYNNLAYNNLAEGILPSEEECDLSEISDQQCCEKLGYSMAFPFGIKELFGEEILFIILAVLIIIFVGLHTNTRAKK